MISKASGLPTNPPLLFLTSGYFEKVVKLLNSQYFSWYVAAHIQYTLYIFISDWAKGKRVEKCPWELVNMRSPLNREIWNREQIWKVSNKKFNCIESIIFNLNQRRWGQICPPRSNRVKNSVHGKNILPFCTSISTCDIFQHV